MSIQLGPQLQSGKTVPGPEQSWAEWLGKRLSTSLAVQCPGEAGSFLQLLSETAAGKCIDNDWHLPLDLCIYVS